MNGCVSYCFVLSRLCLLRSVLYTASYIHSLPWFIVPLPPCKYLSYRLAILLLHPGHVFFTLSFIAFCVLSSTCYHIFVFISSPSILTTIFSLPSFLLVRSFIHSSTPPLIRNHTLYMPPLTVLLSSCRSSLFPRAFCLFSTIRPTRRLAASCPVLFIPSAYSPPRHALCASPLSPASLPLPLNGRAWEP